jgi:hypothetical protein
MNHVLPIFVAAALSVAAMSAMAADTGPQVHPDVAPVSPLATQPLDRLSATRERPLFSPTRQPPPPPPVIPDRGPPILPPPNVALLGVIMDGEDASALVRAGPAAKLSRVRIGDDLGGWKVGQIEARQLVLVLDGRTARFTIFTGNSGKAPAADPNGQSSVAQHQSLAQQHQISPNAPSTERTRQRKPHLQQQ